MLPTPLYFKCDREGWRGHKDRNVYLDSTKSNSSWLHSLIFSKSKVVVPRTQDFHIPWEGEGRKGNMKERREGEEKRRERTERREEGGEL